MFHPALGAGASESGVPACQALLRTLVLVQASDSLEGNKVMESFMVHKTHSSVHQDSTCTVYLTPKSSTSSYHITGDWYFNVQTGKKGNGGKLHSTPMLLSCHHGERHPGGRLQVRRASDLKALGLKMEGVF